MKAVIWDNMLGVAWKTSRNEVKIVKVNNIVNERDTNQS